ncbi:MAG: SH3-like domain-containing protein [Pseudomonadota bacterium]
MTTATANLPPRFTPGTIVRVSGRGSIGHCRTPHYLRGQIGEVVSVEGCFRDPERIAYNRPGLPPQYLYRVRFPQTDLWPAYGGDATDMLEANVYENWLESADTGTQE